MKEKASKLSFGAAMQELEGILSRVEGEEIDIDELAEELKRAAELLEVCRAKIRRAEVEVSQIVQTLEEPEAQAAEPRSPELEAPELQGAEPGLPVESEAEASAAVGKTASLFEHDD